MREILIKRITTDYCIFEFFNVLLAISVFNSKDYNGDKKFNETSNQVFRFKIVVEYIYGMHQFIYRNRFVGNKSK